MRQPTRPRSARARGGRDPLADRSVGTPDPGAVSFALVVSALANGASTWADSYNAAEGRS